jgi:peptidoglycan/LPS O-acetylase OafA/YrhL
MSVHHHSDSGTERPQGSFPTSRAALAFIGFAIIAGALLFTEHRAHVLGALIWLPLLACLLMHVFMHHGHGGHGGPGQQRNERKAP